MAKEDKLLRLAKWLQQQPIESLTLLQEMMAAEQSGKTVQMTVFLLDKPISNDEIINFYKKIKKCQSLIKK